ncbi:MAG: ATP-binding cassette domain-containing protein [Desulfovibrionaceae bacterium]|jgi:ATP-binding cassette subfamily C protein LapB|nr:ATP-binding cassette domain-containing protein [Desulfovibrionaceae bacterium]
MKELFRRLTLRPLLAAQLLTATLVVTFLNLASPLFVIQVLNLYVTFGLDGTLLTLTVGMCIALALLLGFLMVRTKLALAVSVIPDQELAEEVYRSMTRVRSQALDHVTKTRVQELPQQLQHVQTGYEAQNVTSVLDAPFSMLYVIAALLLSPGLAIVGLVGMGLMLGSGWLALGSSRRLLKDVRLAAAEQRAQALGALYGVDTVRAFRGESMLRALWGRQVLRFTDLRMRMAENRGLFQNVSQTVIIGMSVLIYALGAREVVSGTLSMGALIGVNILVGRAMQTISRFVMTYTQLKRADEALAELHEFTTLPVETEEGTVLREYLGRLTFKDVSLAFPGATGPLYENLSVHLEPGSVVVVAGHNGAGKTSLMRLVTGLIDPDRGEILADGVNVRQLDPAWWRKQFVYMPQEPAFLNATMRENILAANPELGDERLNRIVNEADLGRFLHSRPDGLDTPVTDSGRTLSLGVRRRLALARALATDGRLVLLDEPTEGLDADGCRAMYALLNRLAREGRTILAATHDPNIVKGAGLRINLNRKPVPQIEQLRPAMSGAAGSQGSPGTNAAAGPLLASAPLGR